MRAEKVVYVVSAPSGTGKTTLNRRLLAENRDRIEMSVSYTARPIRPGEVDGVDYHFISAEKFRELIAAGEMLEYAEVFGTLYGTSIREVNRINSLDKTVLLEIDVQGWAQAKKRLRHAVSVFILPPSVKVLWERLEHRGTEPPAVRFRRLMTARKEIEQGHLYDFFIVNSDVDTAYEKLHNIVIKEENGEIAHTAGVALCQNLLDEFANAPWLRKLSNEFADK